MLFRRTPALRSAFSEIQLVGSRWSRILGKTVANEAGLAVACVTMIPTLHIASPKFYDRVLEYMQQAVRRNKNTVILLEGICDSEESEKLQLQEYRDIARNDSLRHAMTSKADQNTLYPPEVMKDICNELAINYDVLMSYGDSVRLQECYLKPKMAALCGEYLRNDADLNMVDIQKILQSEAARLAAIGEALPSTVSVSEIGSFPTVRKNRERRVAAVARRQCEAWLAEEMEGEVIVPWGFFHTEAITHYILEGNHTAATPSAASDSTSTAVAAGAGMEESTKPARSAVVFVEADEVVAKVPFDVPKELIEREPSAGVNASDKG